MQDWIDKYLGTLLTIGGTTIMLIIAILGYFLKRTIDQVDTKFNQQYELIMKEVEERKSGDKDLELMINSKLDTRQFNEFKASAEKSFGILEKNQDVIQEDIKEILKNTR